MNIPKNNSNIFTNEKLMDIGDYNLKISSNVDSIKLLLQSKSNPNIGIYEEIYTLEKFEKINKIFSLFDSIESIKNSIEDLISKNKYEIKKNTNSIELILKTSFF